MDDSLDGQIWDAGFAWGKSCRAIDPVTPILENTIRWIFAYMPQLPELLTALTEELVQIRDGLRPAVARDGTPLERSEDKDFIYLEADAWGRDELINAAERLDGLAWLGPGRLPGE